MSNTFTELNKIPVVTWSWLQVNDTRLAGDFPQVLPYRKDPLAEGAAAGAGIQVWPAFEEDRFENIPSPKVEEELLTYMKENRNSGYAIRIPAGHVRTEPIRLNYVLDEHSPVLVDEIIILAEKDSRATVLIHYTSETEAFVGHSGFTRIYAEPGAELTLIKIQILPDLASHVDHVVAVAAEDAKVRVLLAELGAGESVTNCSIDLAGPNAEGEIDSIYLGDKERVIDINYHIKHYGENTVSNIDSNGVLADKCEKIFRGTIDFISGAAGSKGSEEEVTVLLSPEVKNVSAPLLLCGEEDVEGAHAVTTGTLDAQMLYYLMTRGLDEAEAKKLVVEASFSPMLEKIGDESLRKQIFAYVRDRLSHV